MKRFLTFVIAVLTTSLLAASGVSAQEVPPSTPGVLKVGFIPAEDARAMVRQSQAIMDKLSAALGMKVEAFVGSDYNATIEALQEYSAAPPPAPLPWNMPTRTSAQT